MPTSMCFIYPAEVPPGAKSVSHPIPPGVRQMPAGTSCFRYPAEVPGVRQMPTGTGCFRYPTTSSCFIYPADVPGLRQMTTSSSCFRY